LACFRKKPRCAAGPEDWEVPKSTIMQGVLLYGDPCRAGSAEALC
jgi:hypothetical protein